MMQFFKMTFHPYTARSVHSWIEEHEYALQHLPRPEQSPDLIIIKSLWSDSESTVWSRFPLLSSLKQIQDVLHEDWCIIPLETIQNVRESIPRRIQTITVKWWFNSILINKYLSFTTISLILSIPCSFTCCISLCYLNNEVLQSNILNQMMAYWS